MADLFKLTVRGNVLSSHWAINCWWKASSPAVVLDETEQAQALANAATDYIGVNFRNVMSNAANITKVIAEGYDAPAAFYEQSMFVVGLIAGDDMPSFVAMGFRQYRSNNDFRASTHRLPGVVEENNAEGSWAYSGSITAPQMLLTAAFFSEPLEITIGAVDYVFDPVLIRTQHTPRTPGAVTVFFDPPETSPVASASFYGLTSQVSRKVILGS